MTSTAREDEARRMVEVARLRRLARTREQQERAAVLDERSRRMMVGVWRPPVSLFAKPKK